MFLDISAILYSTRYITYNRLFSSIMTCLWICLDHTNGLQYLLYGYITTHSLIIMILVDLLLLAQPELNFTQSFLNSTVPSFVLSWSMIADHSSWATTVQSKQHFLHSSSRAISLPKYVHTYIYICTYLHLYTVFKISSIWIIQD